MSKVLVTGATGFIGKRLIFQLLQEGHEVHGLSRIRGMKISNIDHPNLHVLFGDLKDPSNLDPFPKDIDAAYYLIHSMAENVKDLLLTEESTAKNFTDAIAKTNCKQIIYLGGIIDDTSNLSPHLASRYNVEKVLKKGPCPVTILRSSIIIGAGSASFEIIRDTVEKLPFMITPRWVKTLCQPIAISDVLYYLSHALLHKDMEGITVDIGGPEVLSFKEVLLGYAKFRDLKRLVIDVPCLTPKLSSYWLALFSSVRFSLCYYLVESMRHNSICRNDLIQKLIPHKCMSLQESIQRAFIKISQNEVISTWMDSWLTNGVSPDINKFVEVPKEGCLRDIKEIKLGLPKEEVLLRIWSIGGENGWHGLNWAWKIRGLIDKCLGGAGINIGRRHPTEIEVGDSIDFWRVVKADKENAHLILYAEMLIPGEAWLEFKIENNTLYQTATFRPKGLLGRCYWYAMLPFHFFIFKKMAVSLARKLHID